ncbi:hypothetical protein P280DRAFT_474304 [Massarina eburnea CBS 473.64]|uniref:Uncharacterized protein n=1 Tax=Massarina eburnea CBS 473.64 TaxID=1395130 RepID=A0A6A6RH97_9PLEO|nr:hypothetical protein P280DRAFT_474304 [Massarina eburnea CBS 473.64]
MLAPRASGAFVCFRCELHRARPHLPALARRAPFSTSVRRRNVDETLQPFQPEQPEQPEQPQKDKFHIYPQLNERPLIRVRRPKGKKRLRASTAILGGVKRLGDDADILLIREEGEDPIEEPVTPEPDETYPAEAVNIIGSLQEEKKPITLEEVVEKIDSLRPKTLSEPDEPQYINQSTFIRVSQTLLASFTSRQLSHYYSVTKGVERKDVGKQVLDSLKQMQSKEKRPAERSGWHPGRTPIDRRLPGLDVHRRKRKPVSKHLIVDQILRGVWGFVMLEEIESSGELELLLKPWQLSVLTSGASPTPLDRIGRDRKASIEMHTTDHVVRVTADKSTAEYVANDIEKLVHDIETKHFDVSVWAPYLEEHVISQDMTKVFRETDLEAVSTMTEASIHVKPNMVIIHALNKDIIAEAERCLIKMLPFKKDAILSMDTTRRDAAKDQSYLVPIHFDQADVDFYMRNRKFGRWTLPVTHANESTIAPEEEQSLADTQKEVSKLIDYATAVPEDLKRKITGAWTFAPQISVGALFGRVMVPMDDSQNKEYTDTSVPPFLTSIPGLAKLLTDKDFLTKSRYAGTNPPTLQYSFVADPNQRFFEKGQQFPNLNIQFRYNEHKQKHFLRRIYLGFNNTIHDVLLPGKAIDVRFSISTMLRMHTSSAGSIRGFAKAVQENLQSGSRLKAPSIDLDIPLWVIPGQPPDSIGVQTVKYLFTGVRFRQSAQATLFDADVSLGTVQSGKLGRKGVSLSTFWNTTDSKEEDWEFSYLKDEKRLGSFVKNSFAIADKITEAAAHNQSLVSLSKENSAMPEDVREDVRDLNSERDLRRQDYSPVRKMGARRSEEDLAREVLTGTSMKKPKDPSSARALKRQVLYGAAAEGAEAADGGQVTDSLTQSAATDGRGSALATEEQIDELVGQPDEQPVDQQDIDKKEIDQQEVDQQEVDQQEIDKQEIDKQEIDQQEIDSLLVVEEEKPNTQQHLEAGDMEEADLSSTSMLSNETSSGIDSDPASTPPTPTSSEESDESDEVPAREDDEKMNSVG